MKQVTYSKLCFGETFYIYDHKYTKISETLCKDERGVEVVIYPGTIVDVTKFAMLRP